MTRRPAPARSGGITAITLLMLVPLLAMVAFALDLNYVWRADAELQTAADAAAQAGCARLMKYAVLSVQPGANQTFVRVAAQLAVAQQAVKFGQMHTAGDSALVVNFADVELGYVADPAAPAASTAGQFQTGPSAPFPNSVRVTVRRDGNVSNGPLPLFFGPVLGTPSVSLTAVATATLRGQNVTGFSGSGSKLMPIGLSLQSYQYLTGAATAPGGVLTDNYTVTSRTDGGAAPPANVTAGADGIKEVSLYPDPTSPGNFGLVSLTSGKATSQPAYANWISNGPSAADLASFGSNGLQVGSTVYGGPGMKSSLSSDFASLIGQPRVFAIVGAPSGNGSNTTYPVVGFTGGVIVSVSGTSVSIQLSPVVDLTANLGGGADPGAPGLIYRGISLSR